jgi:transcriptional regulator with XRE-family HTH domain
MPAAQDAAVQQRRLRGELRRARNAAGYTQNDVAVAMDWSPSKLTRIELGKVGISTVDLRALLDYYGVKDPTEAQRLIEMAQSGRSKQAWWTQYRESISAEFLAFLGYEASASSIYHFEPALIPGPLQLEGYIRAVLRELGASTSEQVDKLVELRLRRQKELFEGENAPEMVFIMSEGALRPWVGGRDVMRDQLKRLSELQQTYRNVTVEVVPFTAGAHPGMKGSFVIMQFPHDLDEDVLFLEDFQGDTISREERDVLDRARDTLGRLRDLAATTTLDDMIDSALRELG